MLERVRLSMIEKSRLILPYAYHNIKEQFIVVVPVCLYIVFFQLTVLQYGLGQVAALLLGIILVFVGLAFFLEGIRIGPVPIGEIVGNTLPKKHSALIVLIFAFFLGLLASFGEPVLGTLQMAGAHIKREHAPLLYDLLVGKPMYLVLTVGLGVGIACLIGTMRFLYGWSLKVIILPLVLLGIILTVIAANTPILASAIGLAWDTGAVIVGPVLCPLVLALGVGVCRASGKTSPTLAGFGMVGLISVVPIAAVVILTFTLYSTGLAGQPEVAKTESQSSEVVEVAPSLPAEIEFASFYPKLRVLSLPSSLDYALWEPKIVGLETANKELFLAAYEVDEHEKSISQLPRMTPQARHSLPALLESLGFDPASTALAQFEKVYRITVIDEAKLTGTIALLPTFTPHDAVQARALLTSMGWTDNLPLFFDSFVLGARAILPIFLFLFIVMVLLKQQGPPLFQIFVSLAFAIIGLTFFFFGLSIGLGTLGNQIGDRLPAAFLDYVPLFPFDLSLFSTDVGKVIVILFALVLGYGATLAEPAFNVLGQQVEDVTQGSFKKSLFSQAVALGVGVGAALGIMSLLYDINLLYLLLPPYVLLAILTFFNREIFVNIAWDGGAVTTGPVTVPLKLAIGLSLSTATGAGEGFGVLALASAYPVLNILLLGIFLSARKPKEEMVEA